MRALIHKLKRYFRRYVDHKRSEYLLGSMKCWHLAKCLEWLLCLLVLTCVVVLIIRIPSIYMEMAMNRWDPLYKTELQVLYNEYLSRKELEEISAHAEKVGDVPEVHSTMDSRTAELKSIHDFIYATLDALQNEGDCETKKIIRCTNSLLSGFGSTIHRHVICLHIAFALGRAFFIDQEGFEKFNGLANFTRLESGKCGYLKGKLKGMKDRCNFRDLNCYVDKDGVEIDNKYRLLEFTREADFPAPKYIPGTLPGRIAERLEKIGVKRPWHWFTAQLLGYMIMRPNAPFEAKYTNGIEKTGLTHPMVGIHFRGTDKVFSESRYISQDTYIDRAVGIFNEKINSTGTRYVYLASDDTRMLRKMKKDLKDGYVVRGNPLGNGLRLIGRRNDADPAVMEKMLMDLYFMVRCDHVIVTYSSNIGRLIWELKTSQHPYDPRDTVVSMDYNNIFYGWYAYEARVPYYVTVADNNRAVVHGEYTIMTYKKGQLYHRRGDKSTRSITVNGKPVVVRFVRPYRNSVVRGYIYEKDLREWPGTPRYQKDMV